MARSRIGLSDQVLLEAGDDLAHDAPPRGISDGVSRPAGRVVR